MQIGDALLEIAQILDAGLSSISMALRPFYVLRLTHLQNGQLVHLLTLASGYHVLQHSKFLVHLGPPPPLDQTVCGLAGNLSSCCCGACIILLSLASSLSLSLACRLIASSRRTILGLGLARLHLNDLPGASWRRWQGKVVFGDHARLARRSFPSNVGRRSGRDGAIGGIGAIGRRRGRARACSVRIVKSSGGQVEGRCSVGAFLASDVARGAWSGRRIGSRHSRGRVRSIVPIGIRGGGPVVREVRRVGRRPSGEEKVLGVGRRGGQMSRDSSRRGRTASVL